MKTFKQIVSSLNEAAVNDSIAIVAFERIIKALNSHGGYTFKTNPTTQTDWLGNRMPHKADYLGNIHIGVSCWRKNTSNPDGDGDRFQAQLSLSGINLARGARIVATKYTLSVKIKSTSFDTKTLNVVDGKPLVLTATDSPSSATIEGCIKKLEQLIARSKAKLP